MAFRQRTPTFRPQLSVRRVYETLEPRSEMKETPEAYLQHVYLPGFTKDRIKITLEDSSRMVRITGERPIQGNRWIKFDQTYPVPEDSEVGTLEGKFEGITLILKLQKKFIPQVAPKLEEVEPTQVKSPKSSSELSPSEKAVDESKPEKVQETIPPQPTNAKLEEPTEDKKSDSLRSPVKDPANDIKAQKDAPEDTTSSQIPQETITNNNPKKVQEEAANNFQKGKEEFEPKTTSTETTKTQTDEKPQKGQEEAEPKPEVTTDTKEELKAKIVETSAKEAEKERISKVASESSKPVKDMEKGKEAEPLAPKVEEKEKESCCRNSPNQEGNKSGDGVTVGNGMRKLVASSSQLVTRMAEGTWNEQEKHLIENIGAAVLVIAALGAYVSYRFAS